MKSAKSNEKLQLNKQTIVSLQVPELAVVKGGTMASIPECFTDTGISTDNCKKEKVPSIPC